MSKSDTGALAVLYIAGILAFITSLPQLYQIIKTKKVRDINPYFFFLHCSSDVLYLCYGIIIEDYMITYSFTLPAVCNIIIFILWFYYRDSHDLHQETQTNIKDLELG